MSNSAFQPADRISAIEVSPILRITRLAAELQRAGRKVLALGVGEPDFDTPDPIKDAATRAIRSGDTKYTTLDGTPELKTAICGKFRRDNQLAFSEDEITVGAGAKQVIFNAMLASLNPGDEVILASPYWVSYADIVRIAGGIPVIVPCRAQDQFRLTPQALEAAITERTRWLFLNSPSNPTGSTYSKAEYYSLAGVLALHPRVWVLADDIYEHLVYDGFEFTTPVQADPALRERALTVNGVSKAYAMTGWRIGYGAGPKVLIRAMAVVQSQSTSCPSSVSQAAAIAALTGPQDTVGKMREAFQARRDLVVDALNAIPGISCRRPEGAFYAFADCADIIGRRTPDGTVIRSDLDFADYLLRSADVAVVPGAAFGASPYIRISYAAATADLEEALARIAAACGRFERV